MNGERMAGGEQGGGGEGRSRDDAGSVTVTMLGIVMVSVLLAAAVAVYGAAAVASARARSSADQSALAAASVLLGASDTGQLPCAVARVTASRNGTRLISCRVLSTSVQVEVERQSPFAGTARSVARAGQAEPGSP